MDFKAQNRFLLPVFIPSVLFLFAIGAPVAENWDQYREVFGSENYYLTLLYPASPANRDSSRFLGSLVTPDGEFRLSGKRWREGDGWRYELRTAAGTFGGRLPAERVCPVFLNLTPLHPGPAERLRAGFCPSL